MEAARPRYEEVFTRLATAGVPRNEVQLALEWTTASREHVLGPILGMRAEVFRRAEMTDGLPFTIARVQESPNANVARIVYGTFTPPNYLREDNSLVFAPTAPRRCSRRPRSYPFTMVVPARALHRHRPDAPHDLRPRGLRPRRGVPQRATSAAT
jgi:hypothetical protein